MKQTAVLLVTATIIGLLFVSSFALSSKPVVHAQSNSADWQVTVNGLVNIPTNFTLVELEAMPQTTEYADLVCVGTPDVPLTEGNWTGVELWSLIEAAGGALPGAIKVAFFASDGFKTDLSIATAQES